jgi:hypothetical protein
MVIGTNLWLYEQKQIVVGTKTYGCRKKTIFSGKNLWLRKEIIGCGNKINGKNKCLWKQSHMVVGTKTYGCGNKRIW